MSYNQIWEATKISSLVTWSVMFSLALTVVLDLLNVIRVQIPFNPSTMIYFFGVLQSSVFAVSYVNRRDWTDFSIDM